MNMKPSKVLNQLRSGEMASCTKLNLADSRTVEIAGIAGFDCVWTDMEHVPNDLGQVEKQILAAKAYDMDILVRVPRGSYSSLVWPLEMDATGIMVPHVMSLADARQVVRQTRFHPVGRRPVDGGNADGGFCKIDFNEYLKQANENRFVIIQIEDPEPLAELDEIASLPGIDVIFFGPGDFSHSIGHPGEFSHPDLIEARRLVAEAAIRHGKFAGTVGGPGNLDELLSLGYRFISMGADVVGLTQYFGGLADAFRGRKSKEVHYYGNP
ncbi:MAG TPA: aldolase [Clostridiales bacterium]|nr:aldolase [Clostridiales bacterium]